MCLPDPMPDATPKRWRRLCTWLRQIWGGDDLALLDDWQRRDIGLPRRHRRPDAATLLDMSHPGAHRGGRRW